MVEFYFLNKSLIGFPKNRLSNRWQKYEGYFKNQLILSYSSKPTELENQSRQERGKVLVWTFCTPLLIVSLRFYNHRTVEQNS